MVLRRERLALPEAHRGRENDFAALFRTLWPAAAASSDGLSLEGFNHAHAQECTACKALCVGQLDFATHAQASTGSAFCLYSLNLAEG